MWGRFLEWFYRRSNSSRLYGNIVFGVLCLGLGVTWFVKGDDLQGSLWTGAAAVFLLKGVAGLRYRRRHPFEKPKPWLDSLFD